MEHLLIYVIHFILWLDRKSQRPVRRVIPNLDELLEQPTVVLSRGDIVIGPFQRWSSGLSLGSVLAFILAGLWSYAFSELTGKVRGRPWKPGESIFFLLVLLVIIVGSLWLTIRWLRGGYLTLSSEGVVLRYRKTSVRCPWSLFDAPGNPFQPSQDRILLPVDPASVPYVEAYRSERFLGQGIRVKTKTLQFKSSSLTMLRSIYAAKIDELGLLLLKLGRMLGPGLPKEVLIHAEQQYQREEKPTVGRRADGWITAPLTNLELPPYCCDCGSATRATKDYQIHSFLGETATIDIPVCPPCQRYHESVQRGAIGRGALVGVTAGVAASILLGLLLQAGLIVVLTIVPFILIGLTMGAVIGTRNGKRKSQPVLLRNYSPSVGTIALWFRNGTYSDAVMEVMKGQDEEESVWGREEERPALRW